ncbi:MAG TPA: hypothetical protein VFX33_00265 [Actinomycetales bacterium]|nr:hypothetical protein [Actinomycetales bacterium]
MPAVLSAPRARGRALLAMVAAVVLLLTGLPLAAAAPGTSASRDAVPGPVVLIGVPGLRWDDVTQDRTPALWSLLQNGSVGTIAVRSVYQAACPVDGWLAVSAGRRLADQRGPVGCPMIAQPMGTSVPNWDRFTTQAANQSFEAQPGALGDALKSAGVQAAAVGGGAAIAIADSSGKMIGPYFSHPPSTDAFAQNIGQALDRKPALLVVDAGDIRDPQDLDELDPARRRGDRAQQAQRLDAEVRAALDAVEAKAGGDATVLVTSFADSGMTAHLGLMAATGPAPQGAYAPGLLGSRSTRQPGLVQATDVMPTLLWLLGVDAPSGLVGSPVRPLPGSAASTTDRLRHVLDLDESAAAVKQLIPPFFAGLVIAELLLYGLAAIALRVQWGGPRGRRPVLRWLRRVALVFAAVPVATFLANLVPWWRTDNDLLAAVAAVGLCTGLVIAVATLGPWRNNRLGPFGAIAGITALVLAVDVATGSHLQLSSLMGQQPLVGGRFYGLGNVQFALFGTGALLLATALADSALRAGRRKLAVLVVAVIGVLAVVIDGAPGIGSDFGGPPALIPAFAVLALLVAGVRLTWRRLLLVGVVTLVVVAGLSVVDWLRPPADRTHLGRFVQTVLDGGALPVIERKLAQNLAILTGSPLTLIIPFGAVFVGLILMRPVAWGAPALQRTYERAPTLRYGLIALLVMLGIGFAVNDSGTVVPAIGAVLAIPLLIAAAVRTLELADEEFGQPTSLTPDPTPATPQP